MVLALTYRTTSEILTHILSHLHPDSHAAVALVSKRFYALVTTPHAWRMAFMRYFPGHSCLTSTSVERDLSLWEGASDVVQSDVRYFGRLTTLATWRSEYLFRTRLLRSLARGKPGTISGSVGSSGGANSSFKRGSAVLTYNSKLPWQVTAMHAAFTNGKKPPRVLHGAADLGSATASDPTTGRVEKWGLEDPYFSAQLEEMMPNAVPYGLGDGPVAVPNVMDISHAYGVISGEGFPGGRCHFRSINSSSGRYLDRGGGAVDPYPDIPRIPDILDAICSVWIAKSSAVPAATQSMFGLLTGSALGVVTAYALGWDPSGPRYPEGEMTVRWVLSPGVPIIALKIDDNYSIKRRMQSRVWAVALNALGEVYYLSENPIASRNDAGGDDVTRQAWLAGRTARWRLMEPTKRVLRSEGVEKGPVHGAHSAWSSRRRMDLGEKRFEEEAREMEGIFLLKPSHFINACEGWDMQRRLEVDFANDDNQGAGESIFVIGCGTAENTTAKVWRYKRRRVDTSADHRHIVQGSIEDTGAAQVTVQPSVFGSVQASSARAHENGPSRRQSLPPFASSPQATLNPDSWDCISFEMQHMQQAAKTTPKVTASCLDGSCQSTLTLGEDSLHAAQTSATMNSAPIISSASVPFSTGRTEGDVSEIPGRRARYIVVGTDQGSIIVWNAREEAAQGSIQPIRVLQTDSPQISCVAASALYLVHGGSDGLVQAWDPLASTLEPIRTINARSNGRIPRNLTVMNPTLREDCLSAVGAIFLDPDSTILRGVLACGAFVRYWTYSSVGHAAGRKRRRIRHSDVHGRVASRRLGGRVSGYIAAEEAELRRENETRAREQARLRKRFGLGALGDLTDEEALRYVQMVSEEAFVEEEQRRASDSAADGSIESGSSLSETTADTLPPESSATGHSHVGLRSANTSAVSVHEDDESEFEQQVQRAIRLSLLEGVNDAGESPRAHDSSGHDFPVNYRSRTTGKSDRNGSSAASASGPSRQSMIRVQGDSGGLAAADAPLAAADDVDLALALSLSMHEQTQQALATSHERAQQGNDDFPPLDAPDVGKGKGARKW